VINLNYIDSGNGFDFGNISQDYAKYRDIYPAAFFDKIRELKLCEPGQIVLDLGTGTGVLPRHLARYGAKFVGADISEGQIGQAKALSAGMDIEYVVSPAEQVSYPAKTFDSVFACMCFTYFDKKIVVPQIARMLKDDGRFAIMSLVWLPNESDIAKRSEELVLKFNPAWNGVGYDRPKFRSDGVPTTYDVDLSLGFELDTAFAFDVDIRFTRETWHGRMKATRGLAAASITKDMRDQFEREHVLFLESQHESFDIPHSATFCILKKA
jgi:SAM-dependent methyltransferase